LTFDEQKKKPTSFSTGPISVFNFAFHSFMKSKHFRREVIVDRDLFRNTYKTRAHIVLESVPKASFQRHGKQATSASILFQAKVNRCFAPNKYFPAQLPERERDSSEIKANLITTYYFEFGALCVKISSSPAGA